ncbi:UNVERIFIED_CONTAM: Serine/arginine repetitive matrix protein 1 [Sesamum indicum]
MSGGFFRGTSADQDTRFSNKQAKLLKSQKFAPELENLVDMTKVKMDVMRPWIAKRVTELIGFEDEVLINFIYSLLEGKEVNGKQVHISLTGFMERNTGKFMKELWALLLSAQQNVSGVPQQFLDAKEEETKKKKAETDRIANEIHRKKEKEKQEIEQEKIKMDGDGAMSRDKDDELDLHVKNDAGGSGINPADDKERYKRNGRRRRSSLNFMAAKCAEFCILVSGTAKCIINQELVGPAADKSRNLDLYVHKQQWIEPRVHNLQIQLTVPHPCERSDRYLLARPILEVIQMKGGGQAASPEHRQEVAPFLWKDGVALLQGGLSRLVGDMLLGVLLHHGVDHCIPKEDQHLMLAPDLLPLYVIGSVLRGTTDLDLPCDVDHDPLCAVPDAFTTQIAISCTEEIPVSYARQITISYEKKISFCTSQVTISTAAPFAISTSSVTISCKKAVPSFSFNSSAAIYISSSTIKFPLPYPSQFPFTSKERISKKREITCTIFWRKSQKRATFAKKYKIAGKKVMTLTSRHEKYSPARRASPSDDSESPSGNRKETRLVEGRPIVSLRSPQRDMLDQNDLRRKERDFSPSTQRSPFVSDASRGRSYGEERRSTSPRGSSYQKRERIVPESPNPLRKAAGHKPHHDSSGTCADDENKFSSRETGDYKYRSSRKISPVPVRHRDSTESAGIHGLVDGTKSRKTQHQDRLPDRVDGKERHERQHLSTTSRTTGLSVKGSESYGDDGTGAKDKKIVRVDESKGSPKLSRKSEQNDRNGSLDSPSKETDEHTVKVKEKRKHKKSDRQEVESDDYSSYDSYEERKEAKRRRKEEKKLKKEERRRRREERRRRRDERRAEKLKLRSGDAGSSSSDPGRDHSEDESVRGRDSRASNTRETESEQKKLEIELREKALESLRAKKGFGN